MNLVIIGFIPNVLASTKIAFLQFIFVHSVLKHLSSVDHDFEILLGLITTSLDLHHWRTSLFSLLDEITLASKVWSYRLASVGGKLIFSNRETATKHLSCYSDDKTAYREGKPKFFLTNPTAYISQYDTTLHRPYTYFRFKENIRKAQNYFNTPTPTTNLFCRLLLFFFVVWYPQYFHG